MIPDSLPTALLDFYLRKETIKILLFFINTANIYFDNVSDNLFQVDNLLFYNLYMTIMDEAQKFMFLTGPNGNI